MSRVLSALPRKALITFDKYVNSCHSSRKASGSKGKHHQFHSRQYSQGSPLGDDKTLSNNLVANSTTFYTPGMSTAAQWLTSLRP